VGRDDWQEPCLLFPRAGITGWSLVFCSCGQGRLAGALSSVPASRDDWLEPCLLFPAGSDDWQEHFKVFPLCVNGKNDLKKGKMFQITF